MFDHLAVSANWAHMNRKERPIIGSKILVIIHKTLVFDEMFAH